ncbi:MAG TPA: FAD-dependent oxidoreductase, partial [Rhodanobacteraceae bacterium]
VALASGERIAADAVVVNADAAAVADGHFGADAARAVTKSPKARSLSAMTWMLRTKTDGFALHRHNVFFSSDYAREFDEIFKRSRIPGEPTVYVCAQDRVDTDDRPADDGERLFCLVNAPADGDTHLYDAAEIRACEARTFDLLQRCGLTLSHSPERREVSTPSDFNRRYPATGGALYGPASHGWKASFQRNGSRSRIRGLYFAGGSVHPGPGVPMAALSGRLAAASLIEDSRSTVVSLRAATPGGTSTGSAMTDATRSR